MQKAHVKSRIKHNTFLDLETRQSVKFVVNDHFVHFLPLAWLVSQLCLVSFVRPYG